MQLRKIIVLTSVGVSLAAGLMASGQEILHLSLKDALQSVDALNFQVMMANARLEQAIARISSQKSALLPHFDGLVSGGRQTEDMRAQGVLFPTIGPHIGPFNNFDARVRVTMALFDASSFERFQAAKKGVNFSKAELEKTREDVLALVSSLFIDAKRKQETVRLIKTLLEHDQMAFDLSEDHLKQGTGTILDVNRFRSNLDQTKYLYQQAQHDALDALLDLEAALQLPLGVPAEFMDDEGFIQMVELKVKNISKITTSADVTVAVSKLEASQADQKTAYADFLPKISGRADYGRSGESPGHGSNTYFVGIQASVPLWEGGSQQAQLKEVNGEIKEDQENLLDARQQEDLNTAKAKAAITETDELRKAKYQNRETAKRALQIASQSQEIGSGSVLEKLKAQADLAEAEDEYNESQAAWLMAQLDLLHAQGRLREIVKGE